MEKEKHTSIAISANPSKVADTTSSTTRSVKAQMRAR